MADTKSVERETHQALLKGTLTASLSVALRAQRVAAKAREDKEGEWGWGFLYDVTLWNRSATIEQCGLFAQAVRAWMEDPTRETLTEMRKRFILAGMNVNGRGATERDLAKVIMSLARRDAEDPEEKSE